MRKGLAILAGVLVLVLANYSIYSREELARNGRVVLLRLGPVDPRSIMQGDYMRLNFDVARDVRKQDSTAKQASDGRMVLVLDDQGVGTFARLDQGGPLAENEVRLRYKLREHGRIHVVTDAFFFQEGEAHRYNAARYGEFRVADDGDALLTGLRNETLERIEMP